jgi:uncharacterized protein (TIRG00374 family)
VSVVCVGLLVRQVDLAQSMQSLRRLNGYVLLLPLSVFLVAIPLRALRWDMIFPRESRPGVASCLSALGIGNMANFLLPWRAGDVARCVLVGRDTSLSGVSRTLATLGVEKIMDGLALVGMVLLAISTLSPPAWMVRLVWAASAVFGSALVVMVVLRYRAASFIDVGLAALRRVGLSSLGDRIRSPLVSFADGLAATSSAAQMLRLLGMTAAIWFMEALMIWGLALSFGIDLPVESAIVVSAVLGLGLMVPAAPGGLGTYELAGVAGLTLVGVDASSALALTLVIHAWVFITGVGLGLSLLALRGTRLAQLRESLEAAPVADPADARRDARVAKPVRRRAVPRSSSGSGGQMRVLLLSNWFPPVVSGSSFYTSSLAQALVARGHEVAVVTLGWGPEYAPPGDLGFPVHLLPVIRLPKLPIFYNLRLMGLACTPANRKRLRAIVEKFRPDVIHHVNHIFDTTFLAVNVARKAGVPLVGSITTPIQHQNPLRQRVMGLADRLTVGRFGVQRWNGVVCLDRTVYDYVATQYGPATASRSEVIPFAVRMESMAQYEDRSRPRANRPQVLFVGHIHPFRNPVKLVRAIALVARQIPDVRLVLAGRVDLAEPAEVARELGLTGEQVQFLGATPHEQVVELMKSSHVFANWVTGPYKSLGTAPMEAMLCETPVINDLPENLFGEGKLKDGENIVLVDSLDPRAISDAIVRLLKDQAHWRRVGAGGRRFVLEELSWDSIAAQMERFYRLVLGRKQTRVALAGDDRRDS